MTIHVTAGGVLEVIGGAICAWYVLKLLYFVWLLWRWGKR